MGLSIPSELHSLKWLVGSEWPEADEDALWRCGEAWASAACQLRELAPEAGVAGARVLAAVEGDIAESFDALWTQFVGDSGAIGVLAAICDGLAEACATTATEVEYAKYQFILALAMLAVFIAAMVAVWYVGGAAGIPVAIAATQVTVRLIATRLLQAIMTGVALNVAVDGAAQLAQVMQGHRHTWDVAKTRRAIEDGAIFGAASGSVFMAGGRIAPNLMSAWHGQLGAAAVGGALGGVAAPLAHGDVPTGTDFLMALTSGIAGGLGPDLAHGRVHGSEASRLPELDSNGLHRTASAEGLVRSAEQHLLDTGDHRADGGHLSGGTIQSRVDGPTTGAGETVWHGSPAASVMPPALRALPEAATAATAGPDVDGGRLASTLTVDVTTFPDTGVIGTGLTALDAPGRPERVGVDSQQPTPATDRVPSPASRIDLVAPPPAGAATPTALPASTAALAALGPAASGVFAPAPAAAGHEFRPGAADESLSELEDSGATGRDDSGDWELTDLEAVNLVRENMLVTDAGLAFYAADDDIRDFAAAVHPTDGFVTLDLHGSPDAFEIDGYLLGPEQFAKALRVLRDEGVLDLPPGDGIKLLSCDTAVGGSDSPAAKLARELGVDVVAPDQAVWTTPDGDEIVASAALVDGRWMPSDPPDGEWHAFEPSGRETTLHSDPNGHGAPGDGAVPDGRWDEAAPRAPDGPLNARSGVAPSWAHGDWPIGADGRRSQADELRVRRDEAWVGSTRSVPAVADLVRSAANLSDLLNHGVRPADIMANLDDAALARLASGLNAADLAALRDFLADARVRDSLRRSWDESSDDGREILAETMLRQLLGPSDLVRIMQSSAVLMNSLTQRPTTMSNLMRHPRAIEALGEVVEQLRVHGVEAVLRAPRAERIATPLAPWQRDIGAAIRVPAEPPRQPGFDIERRADVGYVDQYLRDLYAAARVAQLELDRLAVEVATETGGRPGWRTEPKTWQRVLDKVAGKDDGPATLHDLAGARIQYDSLADVYHGLASIARRPDVEIAALEDRFANPRPSGYRDIQLKLRMSNGHIAELRLHLRGIDEVAEWEHVLFEVTRDFEALAKLAPPSESESAAWSAMGRLVVSVQQREFGRAVQPPVRDEEVGRWVLRS